MMTVFRLASVLLLLVACGCSAARYDVPLFEYEAGDVVLWKPCSRAQAEILATGDETEIMQSAACSAWLLESGEVKSADYAKAARNVVSNYLDKNPQSGLAHYLLAYLVAKEAQLAPLKGLDLVPIMEQEALRASKLSPEVDFGGPDRMLGELYLRAPSPPVSVGDLDNALDFYAKAVKIAPDFAMNRLGYATALIEDDEVEDACHQYSLALKSKSFDKRMLEIDTCGKLVKACQKACDTEK